MERSAITWTRVLPAFLLVLAALPSRAAAPQPSEYEIREWPTTLRTDLMGKSIKVVLPENAPDRPWDDALMAKFQQLTGIEVEIIRPGNDTTAALAKYLRDFRTGAPEGDVYAIDLLRRGHRVCSVEARKWRSCAVLPGRKRVDHFRDNPGTLPAAR